MALVRNGMAETIGKYKFGFSVPSSSDWRASKVHVLSGKYVLMPGRWS